MASVLVFQWPSCSIEISTGDSEERIESVHFVSSYPTGFLNVVLTFPIIIYLTLYLFSTLFIIYVN